MITISKEKIPEELYQFPVILYGAGYAGKMCKNILCKENIKIEFFVDDNRTKWGELLENIPVHSYDEFVSFCRGKTNVNLILTTIYGTHVAKKIEKISNVKIYEMYNWYTEIAMPDRYGEMIYGREEIEAFEKNIKSLKPYLCDEESYHVYQNLQQYMVSGDINYIAQISTEEEHYFIKEVLEYFGDRAFSIIDAGAYEGELIRIISEMNLNVKEWYCFETNKENFCRLEINSQKNQFKGRQICENKGLWDKNGLLYVSGNGTSSKVMEEGKEDTAVEMITIDEYFKDIHVDFIKMDIEGAELNALKGAMRVIKRDKPVLALSIYHSIEDYYNILKLCVDNFEGYNYYVRHHSLVFCETVLYAIPK